MVGAMERVGILINYYYNVPNHSKFSSIIFFFCGWRIETTAEVDYVCFNNTWGLIFWRIEGLWWLKRLESSLLTCVLTELGLLKGWVQLGLLTRVPTFGFFVHLGLLQAWSLGSEEAFGKRAFSKTKAKPQVMDCHLCHASLVISQVNMTTPGQRGGQLDSTSWEEVSRSHCSKKV